MGKDNIRYMLHLQGRWRWRPTRAMKHAGFRMITLGPGTVIDGKNVPTAEEKAKALELNAAWDRHRMGLPPPEGAQIKTRRYPPRSIGEGYMRAMKLREAERKAKGIDWKSEQHSRDDWPRAWKWIEPLFADCDPNTVTPEQLIGDPDDPNVPGLRPLVAAKVSESEAHRTIKVWRALWKKMAVFGYCDKDRDPALTFANSAPPPRQQLWTEGEAVRLVKAAWRARYYGLSALLAVAWDSQFSPVDARSLKAHDECSDAIGTWFDVSRAKSSRAAKGTLSARTMRVYRAYVVKLPATPFGKAIIFRNRSGAPYSKDTLGDDFKDIRERVFGAGEKRQLADFRRSGTVEGLAGGVQPAALSAKMANSISASTRLQKTYGPVMLATVREADDRRLDGRRKLRGTKTD